MGSGTKGAAGSDLGVLAPLSLPQPRQRRSRPGQARSNPVSGAPATATPATLLAVTGLGATLSPSLGVKGPPCSTITSDSGLRHLPPEPKLRKPPPTQLGRGQQGRQAPSTHPCWRPSPHSPGGGSQGAHAPHPSPPRLCWPDRLAPRPLGSPPCGPVGPLGGDQGRGAAPALHTDQDWNRCQGRRRGQGGPHPV